MALSRFTNPGIRRLAARTFNPIGVQTSQQFVSFSTTPKNEHTTPSPDKIIKLAEEMLRQTVLKRSDKETKELVTRFKLAADSNKEMFNRILDEGFRSTDNKTISRTIAAIIQEYENPGRTPLEKFQMALFAKFGSLMPGLSVPILKYMVEKESSSLMKPNDPSILYPFLDSLEAKGFQCNLNPVAEEVTSKAEADHRIELYIKDFLDSPRMHRDKETPGKNRVSFKVSGHLYPINLIDYETTLNRLVENNTRLFRVAKQNNVLPTYDMEESIHVNLTIDGFKRTLEQEEFLDFKAGIVIQNYLPQAKEIYKDLLEWSKERVKNGGSPIYIRFVKGANFSMENWMANLKHWALATFNQKVHTDTNYKDTLSEALTEENLKYIEIGIASHNLFDIAFAVETIEQNNLDKTKISFEHLIGMSPNSADLLREMGFNVVQYVPIYYKFEEAIPFGIRRASEFLALVNYLSSVGVYEPGNKEFEQHKDVFMESLGLKGKIDQTPQRKQNRLTDTYPLKTTFSASPDTDFSLRPNLEWVNQIFDTWKTKVIPPAHPVLNGKTITSNISYDKYSPNHPSERSYIAHLADKTTVATSIESLQEAQPEWEGRAKIDAPAIMRKVAQLIEEQRDQFIGAMMREGKTIEEGDTEVSEMVDFGNFYPDALEKLLANLDLQVQARGVAAAIMPFNFPAAIPLGNIMTQLLMGNTVLFKPHKESILVGSMICQALWDAGVPKSALHFMPCDNDVAATIASNPTVKLINFVGSTPVARKIMQERPDLNFIAETGGKNVMIATVTDKELTYKEVAIGAFSNAAQKCTATSGLFLVPELYDSQEFLEGLVKHVESIPVGPSTEKGTVIGPLIIPPNEESIKALLTLEEGESWLLQPKQDPQSPLIWTPGIKLVSAENFQKRGEAFVPVLEIVRIDSVEDGVRLINSLPYGLSAGLMSTNKSEIKHFINHTRVGNVYINQKTTGAVVLRQPFGGVKDSSVGIGEKAGWEDAIIPCTTLTQKGLPNTPSVTVDQRVIELGNTLGFSPEEKELFDVSAKSYTYWADQFKNPINTDSIPGQDNYLRYRPNHFMTVRIENDTPLIDSSRMILAAAITGNKITISIADDVLLPKTLEDFISQTPTLKVSQESEDTLIRRIGKDSIEKIRFASQPSLSTLTSLANSKCNSLHDPILANGRYELLRFTWKQTVSHNHHRYGTIYTQK